MLIAKNIDVECFGSAEAYMKVAAQDDADCLILDIHLPGMSGIELRRSICAIRQAPPTIFITGFDNPLLIDTLAEDEYVAYLLKPFSSASLLEAIESATKRAT